MPNFDSDNLDARLLDIANNCNRLSFCTQAPASYAEANTVVGAGSNRRLGIIDTPNFGAIADTDGGDAPIVGRKMAVPVQTGLVNGDAEGGATVMAYLDTTAPGGRLIGWVELAQTEPIVTTAPVQLSAEQTIYSEQATLAA